jgi:hypothetical protein
MEAPRRRIRETMKLLLIAALAALMNAQAPVAAKPDPKAEAPKPTERLLTESESLKIENAMLKVALAQKKFDIDGYQRTIAEPAAVQHAVFEAACLSVGIPRDKINTECTIQGFMADGSPASDDKGQTMPRRVYWNKPQAAK